ncbi:hypothetical protein N7540_005587 [Penicillium herquei]|nr:hypothetical protein N7540_005587 [Penicillium herquei]
MSEVFPQQEFYRGRAKIFLHHFAINQSAPRAINEFNVQRMDRYFQSEGILRLNPDNFIKVLIDSTVLEQALASQNHSEAMLHGPLQFLHLPDTARLHVLQGNLRVLAAKKRSLKWWVAELYTCDMESEIRQTIREEHPNAQSYSDGDIYRKIRHYEHIGDVDSELKWRGRLRKGVQHELMRMEKDFKRTKRSFDRLLPFLGLWQALKLSYLGRWLSVKCPEEINRYLGFILSQWSSIIDGFLPEVVDYETVNELETLMPGLSLNDRAIIQDKLQKGTIFKKLNGEDRLCVLDRLVKINGRILSFHTFTRDFIFFEACMIALKTLLPKNFGGTMLEGFQGAHLQDLSGFNIQVSEDRFENRGLNVEDAVICYEQLFLAVMRDFPSLTSLKPYQDDQTQEKESAISLERSINLAAIAVKLGFQNDAILSHYQETRARYQMVTEEFLHHLQPSDRYSVNNETTRTLAFSVVAEIENNSARMTSMTNSLTTDLERLPKKLRCSRPSYRNYINDRQLLFLENIYRQEVVPKAYTTSFAIQRDIFLSFFGKLPRFQIHPNIPAIPSDDQPIQDIDSDPQQLENSGDHDDPAFFQDTFIGQDPSQDGENSAEVLDNIDEGSQQDAEEWENTSPQGHSEERNNLPNECDREVQSTDNSFETHSVSTMSDFWFKDDQLPFLNQSEKPSVFINDLLAQTNDIILYMSKTRQYARLSTNAEDKVFFDRKAAMLIKQGHMFISMSGRPHLVIGDNLYDVAIIDRLILVCPKQSRLGVSDNLLSQLQKDLSTFIDSYECID